MTTIVGLDLSLARTGYGVIHTGSVPTFMCGSLTSKGKDKDPWDVVHARLHKLLGQIVDRLEDDQPDLIVLEGPAPGARGGHAHDRSGLWWLVYRHIAASTLTGPAVVGPNSRSKYATGKGNDSKDTVMAHAIRRYKDAPIHNNDEADAIVLAAMGARHLGSPVEASLPQTHLLAMGAAQWPR